MKKRIFLIAMALICISTLGYGSLAYYSTSEIVHNVITTGKVDIEIEEWQQTEDGIIPYPDEEKIKVMPTKIVSKIVTVKNNDAESFIRAKLDVTVKDSNDEELEVSEAELEKIVLLEMNTNDWTEKEGWWYYGSSVKAGEVTEALMTEVEFDGPNMTNEYQNCTVEIDVIAQAVQVANNEASALEANGWPKEQE